MQQEVCLQLLTVLKNNALSFHEQLGVKLKEKDRSVSKLRIKVIAFRDYYCDSVPMLESRFFSLPAEKEEFQNFLFTFEADGGGDEPENGLEALALALKSPWVKEGDKRRHITVLWTDASAHRLEDSKVKSVPSGTYPEDIVSSFDELSDYWHGQFIDQKAKRLIVYAPDSYPWTDLGADWDNCICVASKAGEGLSDVDFDEILSIIAGSV